MWGQAPAALVGDFYAASAAFTRLLAPMGPVETHAARTTIGGLLLHLG